MFLVNFAFQNQLFCPSNIKDIQKVFKSISSHLNGTQKHFKKLTIYKTENLSLDNYLVLNESSFWDITFDEFEATQIKMINNNAFGNSSFIIKRFTNLFESNDNFIRHSPPDYQIWKMLNSLINVEIVELGLDINEIPSDAFKAKTNLKSISIHSNNNVTIKRLSFLNLDNLIELKFVSPNIKKIENEAFNFNSTSAKKLVLTFERCNFNSDSFESKSFDGIKTNFQIEFSSSKPNFLSESTFKSVLNNANNIIRFNHSYLNCSDCRNQWMIKNEKDKQIQNPLCNPYRNLTLFSSETKINLSFKCNSSNNTKYFPCQYYYGDVS